MVHYSDDSREIVAWALQQFGPAVAISTSFQREGMVLIDLAASVSNDARVFTIDTGRLPDETFQMIETVRSRYGIQVEIVRPDPAEVDSMVAQHGPNLFYRDVPLRMLCCRVRKVRPLERKLATLEAWITGLRRSQTEARNEIPQIDRSRRPVKISPLADWSDAQVDEYIRVHRVPLHPLYALGYTSIGCDPCTRAPRAGESARDGRWWWEQDAAKECGIHFTANGRAERRLDVLLQDILSHAS